MLFDIVCALLDLIYLDTLIDVLEKDNLSQPESNEQSNCEKQEGGYDFVPDTASILQICIQPL